MVALEVKKLALPRELMARDGFPKNVVNLSVGGPF
jgi:hypothetical protein